MERIDRLLKIELPPSQSAFQTTYLKNEFPKSLVKWVV